MSVKVSFIKKIPKADTVVVGFPGVGLAGSIATSYIIDETDSELIGYVSSPDFAPIASIHRFKPLPPVRIHYLPKKKVLFILSEMSIPVKLSYQISDAIWSIAHKCGAKRIISLGGISLEGKKNRVYVVSSIESSATKIVKSIKAKPIKEGATTGVSGLLLTKGLFENRDVVLLMAEAEDDYPDPRAASTLVRKLSSLMKLDVDTAKLDKDAESMDKKATELDIASLRAHSSDNSMYR